jgi:hypothetical protein
MSLDITYNWNFNPLECYPTESDHSDVVFNVHWQLYATTGSYTASSIGTQVVGPLGTGSFTPFEDLTKDQVQGWVIEAMGTGSVEAMYASLANQIENQIVPPTVTLTSPWLVPSPSPSPVPEPSPTPSLTPSTPVE